MKKTSGKYSVPESIRSHKPRGTMVKKINGKYYVYNMKNIKDEKTGKWKTKTGKVIGKITEEEGYIPNDEKGYSILEYGSYKIAESCSKEIKDNYFEAFGCSENAKRIWCLGLIYAVNGFRSMASISGIYNCSSLSLSYPGLKLGKTAVSNILDHLGRRDTESLAFQNLISSTTSKVAIDGHVISRYSKKDGMSEYGYKFKQLNAEQVNLLTAYDTIKKRPISMKMFDGSKIDKVSVKDLMRDINLKECLFLMDRGFYSKELIGMIAENKCTYIMPLSPNLKSWKKAAKRPAGRQKSFTYTKKEGIHTRREVVEYCISATNGNTRVIAFRNKQEAMNLQANYIDSIKNGVPGFTEEKLIEAEKTFGLIVLETTHDESPDEIYNLYKKRWSVETYFDYLKHQMDFNALGVQDWAKLQGLAFMMLLATLISGSVREKLEASDLQGVYLPDVWRISSTIKIINRNGSWYTENKTKKERDIFEALNVKLLDRLEQEG